MTAATWNKTGKRAADSRSRARDNARKMAPEIDPDEIDGAADGLPTASQGYPVELLALARANGVRPIVRGLTRLTATVDPVEAKPGRRKVLEPGYLIEIETEGRPLDHAEKSILLAFAAEHLR